MFGTDKRAIAKAVSIAQESQLQFKHGAVLTCRNQKGLIVGYNKDSAVMIRGTPVLQHAEMSVLSRITPGLKPKCLYVVRIRCTDKGPQGVEFRNSKPCSHCCKIIKQSAIEFICYSTEKGLVKIPVETLENTHVSSGYKPKIIKR